MTAKKDSKEKAKVRFRIKLRSYDSKLINAAASQIVEIVLRAGVQVIGPIPLPTEIHKYTVNRSTFIHKDAREQYEIRVHKRLVEIPNPNQKFIDSLRDLTLPAGVEIGIKTT